ncbi:nucleotide sugar dehydrogenase [Gammaproteobacteria bacterium]|nr:nucleotide sugar dehydrogenase [Gammaproteobacteria bacterium]MDA9258782.1 nucleotide sugar dehydrogenase [Gammaproteobacteria bacterium]
MKKIKISVIGMGYVGLPLAVSLSQFFEVIGFDINDERIAELKEGIDRTKEVSVDELLNANNLLLSSQEEELSSSNVYIVTVPTPIDINKKPDLAPIKSASNLVGSFLLQGDTVIYESTVYPGLTEEVCVPILSKISNLEFNKDFYIGYSPERINPGDKEHTLINITKIISGSDLKTLDLLEHIYSSIVKAGVHRAESIKVAEMAKVIENTQRDINIALINEVAQICNLVNIDTQSVLKAASTKWNFLQFQPGLVGGHCIGVDPYYLTYKSIELGYHPRVIMSGRELNDSMPKYVAKQIDDMLESSTEINSKSKILILGLTFKENCPDTRNTKIIDLVDELLNSGHEVDIYDPWLDNDATKQYPELNILKIIPSKKYNLLALMVPHQDFIDMGIEKLKEYLVDSGQIYDLKGIFSPTETNGRL